MPIFLEVQGSRAATQIQFWERPFFGGNKLAIMLFMKNLNYFSETEEI